MKSTIFVLFLLACATAACAQLNATVLSSQPVVISMPSHAEHASFQALATPQYVLGNSAPAYAQGVKPLWEFPLMKEAVPLGDVARQLRQEHALAKKAKKVFSDQQ